MTLIEMRAISALRSVRMPHQSRHPQLAHNLSRFLTERPNATLPFVMEQDLWFLVWRYRRQITDREVIARADEVENGVTHLAL